MWNVLQPAHWANPKGYSNGIETRGRQIFLAGMVGWNGDCQFLSDDFIVQCRQALQNIVDTLACADAKPENVVRLIWYVKDKKEYLARQSELGKTYQEIMGKHYPVMTLIQVSDLLEDRARVEIEATAVVPD
jgi:enamine deaminase RidA (YjgF/YER057c/UK114 family)